MVYSCIRNIQRLVYPPTCILCGADGHRGLDLCPGCLADLPRIRHGCPRCGLPVTQGGGERAPCGQCQRRPPAFDACLAPLVYARPVSDLIGGFKFRGDLAAGRLLGELLAGELAEATVEMPQAIVPVPLHRRRLRERGYNQALELARVLARRLDVPLATGACRRVAATRQQAELDHRQRRRNVRGAFRAAAAGVPDRLALVDDVVTTGSTVSEIARVLKNAGARRVEVWAPARRP
jgi:ComF family protein